MISTVRNTDLLDQLGSTSVLADAAGNILNDSDYTPYGGEIPFTTANPSQHYKFTGKERDSETGNDYFGARYYANITGRWLSPDWSAKAEPVPYSKLDDPQSLNLYAYVGNNPMMRVDPDGHDGVENWMQMVAGAIPSGPCVGSNGDCSGNLRHDTPEEADAQLQDPIATAGKSAQKGWSTWQKFEHWWNEGSQLTREFKEMKAWKERAVKDRKMIDNYDPIRAADKGSGWATGESLELVSARYKFEFAVYAQGMSQIAKDMIRDTDSFGIPESRLGQMAVQQMRDLSSGFADGSISASVREAEQEYVNVLIQESSGSQ